MKDIPDSSDSNYFNCLDSEMILSPAFTQTASTQTGEENEEVEFLKLIDKINCYSCQTSERETLCFSKKS